MSNESLVQVPPNVADPLVLQRFLLRLVERLDIVLGNRGTGTEEQYVAQKELLSLTTSLTEQLTEASDALSIATEALEEALSDASETLVASIEELEALTSQHTAQLNVLNNFSWFRPYAMAFEGRSTNGPVTFSLNYNIASGSRVGVGEYEFTLDTITYDSEDLLDTTQAVTSHLIADSVTSEAYYVSVDIIDASLGTFSVSISAVAQGAGSKLAYTPYDPLSTDLVNVVGFYTPSGATPP